MAADAAGRAEAGQRARRVSDVRALRPAFAVQPRSGAAQRASLMRNTVTGTSASLIDCPPPPCLLRPP